MAGQDQKITQLSALTSPSADDLLVIVNDPSGTPLTQKITVDDLFNYIGSLGTTNTLSKFSASGLADSSITDDGSTVEVSSDELKVLGDIWGINMTLNATVAPKSAFSSGGVLELGRNGGALFGGADGYSLSNILDISNNLYISAATEFLASRTNPSALLRLSNDTLSFQNASSTAVNTELTFTERFSVDASGNFAVNTDSLFVDAVNERVGMGTASPQSTLDVDTTTGAIIAPRLTTTQRNALTAVAGMLIYNTTTSKHEGYDGSSWNPFY